MTHERQQILNTPSRFRVCWFTAERAKGDSACSGMDMKMRAARQIHAEL